MRQFQSVTATLALNPSVGVSFRVWAATKSEFNLIWDIIHNSSPPLSIISVNEHRTVAVIHH